MHDEQTGRELRRRKHLLAHKAPIDRPLEQELPPQVKRAGQVVQALALKDEGERKHHLHHRAHHTYKRCLARPVPLYEYDAHGRQRQQHCHFNPHPQREQPGARIPPLALEAIDHPPQRRCNPRIIEQPQQEDAVQPLRADERREQPRRGADAPVAGEDEGDGDEVEEGEDALGLQDVGAVVGEVVEARVKVDVEGRVDERAGVAFEEEVVGRAVEEERHLLHVGLPVDLRVCVANRLAVGLRFLGLRRWSRQHYENRSRLEWSMLTWHFPDDEGTEHDLAE